MTGKRFTKPATGVRQRSGRYPQKHKGDVKTHHEFREKPSPPVVKKWTHGASVNRVPKNIGFLRPISARFVR